jgi:hypothetical protein
MKSGCGFTSWANGEKNRDTAEKILQLVYLSLSLDGNGLNSKFKLSPVPPWRIVVFRGIFSGSGGPIVTVFRCFDRHRFFRVNFSVIHPNFREGGNL